MIAVFTFKRWQGLSTHVTVLVIVEWYLSLVHAIQCSLLECCPGFALFFLPIGRNDLNCIKILKEVNRHFGIIMKGGKPRMEWGGRVLRCVPVTGKVQLTHGDQPVGRQCRNVRGPPP